LESASFVLANSDWLLIAQVSVKKKKEKKKKRERKKKRKKEKKGDKESST
jgi:hypothetical protein